MQKLYIMISKITEIIKRMLVEQRCCDCDKMKNNIPDCHECNPRWRISEDYAREIANEIERKAFESNE